MGAKRKQEDLADTGRHPLYRNFESKRAYPRVKLSMPVQIGLPGGRVVCARIYNLSPDGLQVRCDPGAARMIHPSGQPVAEGQGAEVLVVLRTRDRNDMRTLVVRCRLTYLLAESRDEIILGFSFLNLLPAQQSAIDALLAASLMPT